MNAPDWKQELLSLLSEKDLTRDEILSVAIALHREEKAREMIAFLRENPHPSADEIYRKAGEIAFGKEGSGV